MAGISRHYLKGRANRWTPQVVLTESNIKKLATLSLWINCHIILGDRDNQANNVDSLDKRMVSELVRKNICDQSENLDIKPPKLDHVDKFDTWKESFEHYVKQLSNPEGISYYYIFRSGPRPSRFRDLREELMWKLPLDDSYATYKRDNETMYHLLQSLTTGNSNISAWFKSNDADVDQDARKGYLQIASLCAGPFAKERQLVKFTRKLDHTNWTGYGQGIASTMTADMFKIFSKLNNLGKEHSEIDKIRQFNNHIKPQQGMVSPTCLEAVREEDVNFYSSS